MPARTQTDIDRFREKIIISETGCHEFNYSLSKTGYGRFSVHINGKRTTWQAHRWIYQYTKGPIPTELYVLHKCDNRKCVNPEHLYVGDQFDNMRDMWQRGRGSRPTGEEHFRTYLSESQVSNIKGLAAIGLQANLLAKIFKSHISTIWSIIHNKAWSHIPTPHVVGRRTGGRQRNNGQWKNRLPVNMLTIDGQFIRRFSGITQAAKFINRDATGFREVIKGRQSTWGGYKWEYANKNNKQ